MNESTICDMEAFDFWHQFRDISGKIDLIEAFKHIHAGAKTEDFPKSIEFLEEVSGLQPIYSRQIAALAIAVAERT